MTSLERVGCVLTGKTPDRPPVFLVTSMYAARLCGFTLRELFESPQNYAQAQQRAVETLGVDNLMLPFDFARLAEHFGANIRWYDRQPPNITRPACSDLKSALANPALLEMAAADGGYVPKSPREPIGFHFAAAKILHEALGDRVPLMAVLPGASIFPGMLLGLEGWLEALVFEPQQAWILLDLCSRALSNLANGLFSHGVTVVALPESMALADIYPAREFVARFVPWLPEAYGRFKGPVLFHHSGGSIVPAISTLRGLPNLLGFGVGCDDGLREARAAAGPGMLITGNIDNMMLPDWDATTCGQAARTALEQAYTDGPFILCNSGADINLDTPLENLLAITEAAAGFSAAEQRTPSASSRS